jgi:peroxiredoxin
VSERGISIGEQGPGFELPDTEGQTHEFSGPADAPVTVVYWTCNHCPYALAWHDRLLDAARDYGERGVRFLAVNSHDAARYPRDSLEAMRERVEAEGGWPHPFLHDESQEVARAFGALTTPDVYVFDGSGALRYRGAPDSDYDDPSQGAAWLREAVDAVLEGREVERPETEPVGCGIKWKA